MTECANAGSVQRAIRRGLSIGQILHTHARGAAFEIGGIDGDGLLLLLGKGRHPTKLSWRCLEGIPGVLASRGWVKVGGKFSVEGEPDTLDDYLKRFTKVLTSRWVARVLVEAGIVEANSDRPLRIRLPGESGTTTPA